jgi:hypothetical protein
MTNVTKTTDGNALTRVATELDGEIEEEKEGFVAKILRPVRALPKFTDMKLNNF